jgi:ligand-binding sensor domain-containing protein
MKLKIIKDIYGGIVIIILSILFQNSGCDKVVSVSPPDKPPPNGYIFIDSYPTGAHIYLNGKARRRATPDSLTWLNTSVDTVTLKKELYRDTSFVVNIVEGKRLNVFIDYTKNPLMRGKIYCSSQPQGASIFINDSSTGAKTPNTLTGILPGYYNITFKLENHRNNVSLVTVSSNKTSFYYTVLVDTTVWQDYNTGNSPIITNELSCINIDNNNKLWIGTPRNGIIIFDGSQWLNYQTGSTRLPSNIIYSITTSKYDNRKFVGTESGLAEYYGDGSNDLNIYKAPFYPIGTVRSVVVINDTSVAIATDRYVVFWRSYMMTPSYPILSNSDDYIINKVVLGSNSHVWIGTKNSGVAQFLGEEWLFYTYPSDIISNQITALAADKSGNIWAGHPGGYALANGLSYYDGSWQTFYILPDGSSVNSLFVDSKNKLWIGTNKGLVEKDGAATKLFNYDNTGLNIKNVNGVEEDRDGNIWIITSDAGLFKLKKP